MSVHYVTCSYLCRYIMQFVLVCISALCHLYLLSMSVLSLTYCMGGVFGVPCMPVANCYELMYILSLSVLETGCAI